MITKIHIKKVASYSATWSDLETDKRVNFIYGLNGAGKTTISNFLQDKDGEDFKECSIEGLTDEKLLVYNQNFIENNFYQKDIQRGIFTLSSENKIAEDKIKTEIEKIASLKAILKDDTWKKWLEIDVEKKLSEIQELETTIEEECWKIKTTYSWWDRVLEFCLEGKKWSKQDLLAHLKWIKKDSIKPVRSIEDLRKEAEITQNKDAKIFDENEIQKFNFYFSEIEKNTIFWEVIVGNENSQVAGLIKELKHSDWVKQWIEYTEKPVDKNWVCPFCQEQTISSTLYEDISNYFDKTYQEKINEIKSLEDKYWKAWKNEIENKENLYLQNQFIKNREHEFQILYKNFYSKINQNWSKISSKVKNPSLVIKVETSVLENSALNDFLESIIQEIRVHNEKIRNKQKTRQSIIEDFWKIMRWEYDSSIEKYLIKSKKLEEEYWIIQREVKEIYSQLITSRQIIKTTQKDIVNIDEAIVNINIELKYLWIDSFEIEKIGGDWYKLKRWTEWDAKFKTLSEWEKTIISFLYFLELCKWKEEVGEVVLDKIIVIDDPISSLSHIYVFNIAQIIRKYFLKSNAYYQIFILTHNLYFLTELLIWNWKFIGGVKLFRIVKKSKNSSILSMENNEIQNDYQSYWQILKDHNSWWMSDILLANSMRNILEYFFGFINRDISFSHTLLEIEKDWKFMYFTRYINRESHSDSQNISDIKDIDAEIFKEAFKKIFEDAWYIEHHNKMLGILS